MSKTAQTTGTKGKGLTAYVVVAAALGLAGCGTAMVHTRGDAGSLTSNVSTVVSLAPRLGYGKIADQRRAARRTGDTLIEATGGHTILGDELASTDPILIADSLRALGEDPTRTLTFSITAARQDRLEAAVAPTAGLRSHAVRRFSDYTVRLDIRRADSSDIIGTIETFATTLANAAEVDGAGHPMGLQQAIDEALHAGLKGFAPTLAAGAPLPTIVEVPARTDTTTSVGALAVVDKLRRLQSLYPEQSPEQLAALAASNSRFLIVKPGRLANLGLAAGDLVSGMGGESIGNRAALARAIARGATPALSIERGGGRFLVGQTLVARAK